VKVETVKEADACFTEPMDGGDEDTQCFPISACSCIPFQPLLDCVSQPKVLIISKGYHVMSINIHLS
jgi:hypothetical protein